MKKISDEQRMKDLDAENIMCRRVNAELREQIQGLFKERDLANESTDHANKLCGERTEEWRAQKVEIEKLLKDIDNLRKGMCGSCMGHGWHAVGADDSATCRFCNGTGDELGYQTKLAKAWKTAHKHLRKYADDCIFKTSDLNDGLELEADEAFKAALKLERGVP